MGLTKGIDGIAKTVKGEKDETLSRTPHLSVQHITGPGAIDVVNTVTLLITTGADQAFTLADGVTEGQLKIISMKILGENYWSFILLVKVTFPKKMLKIQL